MWGSTASIRDMEAMGAKKRRPRLITIAIEVCSLVGTAAADHTMPGQRERPPEAPATFAACAQKRVGE